MTDDECNLLIAVASMPGRRATVADLKKTTLDYRLIPALIRDKHLVFFEGGWVGLTDGGYDATLRHCAHNF